MITNTGCTGCLQESDHENQCSEEEMSELAQPFDRRRENDHKNSRTEEEKRERTGSAQEGWKNRLERVPSFCR